MASAPALTRTDIGSDWVPTVTRHVLRHNGRVEVVLGSVDVALEERYARARGLDRYGRALSVVGQHAAAPAFTDKPARLSGWTEPGVTDEGWTFRVEVTRPVHTRLMLHAEGMASAVTLASEYLETGEYFFSWNGKDRKGNPVAPETARVRLVAAGHEESAQLRAVSPDLAGEPTAEAPPAQRR